MSDAIVASRSHDFVASPLGERWSEPLIGEGDRLAAGPERPVKPPEKVSRILGRREDHEHATRQPIQDGEPRLYGPARHRLGLVQDPASEAAGEHCVVHRVGRFPHRIDGACLGEPDRMRGAWLCIGASLRTVRAEEHHKQQGRLRAGPFRTPLTKRA